MADRRRTPHSAVLRACFVLLVACLPGHATASQPSRRAVADLADFVELVAGRFETPPDPAAAQDEDRRREGLRRVVVPVKAGFVGDAVFYLQESLAGDARRVLAQQLLLFALAPGGTTLIVETPVAFKEPLRWRDGDRKPELFRGILPQDVRPQAGCEVFWRRAGDGFEGATDASRCRGSRGDAVVRIERRYLLRATELRVRTVYYDEAGKSLAADPDVHYVRRSP
ncbi:MAG: hypothetical protein RLZZ393_1447 [Pseudomonadota bacterium]|jgi:hypothetical protein